MDRREHILKHVAKDQRGIEIGPWFAPLAPKREGYDCLSFDVFDTDTLRKNAESDPAVDNSRIASIEDVDIVGSATDIYSAIAARGELGGFDYIISSHNFEHLPNPVKFLKGCEKILRPGGYLSMAVPDKRACFDYFKPVSTLGSWLEAYIAGRDRPTPIQVFEQNSLHCRYQLDGSELVSFSVDLDPRQITPLRTLREAYRSLIGAVESGDNAYRDAHCSAFTPTSLRIILSDLAFVGLTHFSVDEISESHGNEFYVHLRNIASTAGDDSAFYAQRHQFLQASLDECAFNSCYAYNLREGERRRHDEALSKADTKPSSNSEAARLAAAVEALQKQNAALENALSNLRNSATWKLASPLWRLETRGKRKAERKNRVRS